MKRPLFWMGITFLSAMAVFLRLNVALAAVLAVIVALSAAFLSGNKVSRLRVLLLICCSVLGAAAALGYNAAKAAYLAPITDSKTADIVMTVTDFDRSAGYRRVKGKALITANGKERVAEIAVWGYFDEPPLPGETLAFSGKATKPLSYSIKETLTPPNESPFKFTAARLKAQNALSQRIYSLSFDDEAGGILSALLTGDRSYIPNFVTSDFRRSSLSHLLAISGMHIVLISEAAQMMFIKSLGKKKAVLLSTLVCWGFAALSGLGVSVIRACVMITIMNLAQCLRRQSDTLTSLMIAALIITLSSPDSLFSASFLLSCAAVIGIAVFAPKHNEKAGIIAAIKQSVGISAAAQLGTLPICAVLFKTVPLIGILANLAAVWLLTPIMLSGIAGVLLGFILPFAAEYLLIPSLLLIKLLKFIAHIFAGIPFSSEGFCEYWQFGWLILSMVLLIIVFCRAPKGFARSLSLSLCTAVYLTMAVFSLIYTQDSVYSIEFEDSGSVAVVRGGHAVLFGSVENSYQLYDIENAFAQYNVQKLDGVVISRHEQMNSATLSLMKSHRCDAIFAKADRFTAQFCRSAGVTLCQFPEGNRFFGDVMYIPSESGFELQFEGNRILKTDNKYDILLR
ncbi:MAG: ComEC/Rec2 family competence protein [Oscillospiraceae bacterium]|nr:ComEC/Rec2 family competence protein [Oscillospiraceae bacterium]